jgi:hypothetical protein
VGKEAELASDAISRLPAASESKVTNVVDPAKSGEGESGAGGSSTGGGGGGSIATKLGSFIRRSGSFGSARRLSIVDKDHLEAVAAAKSDSSAPPAATGAKAKIGSFILKSGSFISTRRFSTPSDKVIEPVNPSSDGTAADSAGKTSGAGSLSSSSSSGGGSQSATPVVPPVPGATPGPQRRVVRDMLAPMRESKQDIPAVALRPSAASKNSSTTTTASSSASSSASTTPVAQRRSENKRPSGGGQQHSQPRYAAHSLPRASPSSPRASPSCAASEESKKDKESRDNNNNKKSKDQKKSKDEKAKQSGGDERGAAERGSPSYEKLFEEVAKLQELEEIKNSSSSSSSNNNSSLGGRKENARQRRLDAGEGQGREVEALTASIDQDRQKQLRGSSDVDVLQGILASDAFARASSSVPPRASSASHVRAPNPAVARATLCMGDTFRFTTEELQRVMEERDDDDVPSRRR